jgi:hypothetical protein
VKGFFLRRELLVRRSEMADTSSIIGSLSAFTAAMAGLSIAVERVVEIIKGAIPVLARTWPKHDEVRASILQFTAAAVGAIIASQMPDQIKSALPANLAGDVHWPMYWVIGLMSSGGAGAWNHALDILGAVKSRQEYSAETVAANTAAVKTAAAGS